MTKNTPANTHKFNLLFYKELIMGLLAIFSFGLIIYELIYHPSKAVVREITGIDVIIAVIFSADYLWLVMRAKRKLHFIRKNWFLLLASIPIVDSWTELLKALRLLEVIRVVRAGEHITSVERKLR